MSNVLSFRRRSPVICTETTEAQAADIQALLSRVMTACPACTGRGVFPHKNRITGLIDFSPCPCGGTEEDRIDLNDFGGAA